MKGLWSLWKIIFKINNRRTSILSCRFSCLYSHRAAYLRWRPGGLTYYIIDASIYHLWSFNTEFHHWWFLLNISLALSWPAEVWATNALVPNSQTDCSRRFIPRRHTCVKVCPQCPRHFQDWVLAILTRKNRVGPWWFIAPHTKDSLPSSLDISGEGVLQKESINSWKNCVHQFFLLRCLCHVLSATICYLHRASVEERCEVIQLFIPIMCIQPRACGTASEWRHVERMWGPNGALAWKNATSMGKSHFADC